MKLIAGHIHSHGLDHMLDALKGAYGSPIEEMYTYIYHEAWGKLSDTERVVLLVMPLSPPAGVTSEFLERTSGLSKGVFFDALNHLVTMNLIERRGELRQARYAIHNLTRTFLQSQVLKWLP
ncbi:MAG: hypothetical protein J5I90_19110 [Caldilineales bacterium]|nr:hypothetical protein [Caldilineales bacterium]